jgi:hypothetical protein
MCSINSEWLIKCTWLKYILDDDTKFFCKVCSKSFTIFHRGENYVKKHANGVQHIKYNTQISQNQFLSLFISSSHDTNADKGIAADLAQVYHAVQHEHSKRLLDCGIKLNSSIYSDSEISKVSCGRIKSEEID